MQATTNLPTHLTSRKYLTTGQAAREAGCCINTIHALLDAGELQGYTTAGGHARITSASVLRYLYGIEPEAAVEDTTGHKGVCIYARVSSYSQKDSLTGQIERLRKEVSKREGIESDVIPLFSDIASSFGERKGLNDCVDAMLDGRVKKVVVLWLDRFSRVPSTTSLLMHIAARCGVEIVALEDDGQDVEEDNFFIKELIAFVTVIANRVSSAKSRLVTVKEVEEGTLSRLFELRADGLSLCEIEKRAEKEGLKTSKGQRLSYYKIKDVLYNGKGEALGAAIGKKADNPHDVLRQWVKEAFREDDGPKARVYNKEVREAYANHCASLNIKPLATSAIGRAMVDVWGQDRRMTTNSVRAYRGLAFV